MPDMRALSKEQNKPNYETLVGDLHKEWEFWSQALSPGTFSDDDIPLILIEPLSQGKKGEAVFEPCTGQFGFSTVEDGRIIPVRYKYDPAEGLDQDPCRGKIPTYRLCERTLTGENGILKSGEEFQQGRILFIKDVMLHEMTHHCVYKIHGLWDYKKKSEAELVQEAEADRPERPGLIGFKQMHWPGFRNEHTKFFRDICNEICARLPGLSLTKVEYYPALRDHEANLHNTCSEFPHNARGGDFYLGALES